jgi:hypothetical protein
MPTADLYMRWPEVVSNEDLWEMIYQEPIRIQIKERKWRWTGHTLRKPNGAVEKKAHDKNPQNLRRQGRPGKTCKRTAEEETNKGGKMWSDIKRLANNRKRWKRLTTALCSTTKGDRTNDD